tara:strand:- start:690 stop:872 length:183 start_codon:yes stop_codon:yes gene_type:complete
MNKSKSARRVFCWEAFARVDGVWWAQHQTQRGVTVLKFLYYYILKWIIFFVLLFYFVILN